MRDSCPKRVFFLLSNGTGEAFGAESLHHSFSKFTWTSPSHCSSTKTFFASSSPTSRPGTTVEVSLPHHNHLRLHNACTVIQLSHDSFPCSLQPKWARQHHLSTNSVLPESALPDQPFYERRRSFTRMVSSWFPVPFTGGKSRHDNFQVQTCNEVSSDTSFMRLCSARSRTESISAFLSSTVSVMIINWTGPFFICGTSRPDSSPGQ